MLKSIHFTEIYMRELLLYLIKIIRKITSGIALFSQYWHRNESWVARVIFEHLSRSEKSSSQRRHNHYLDIDIFEFLSCCLRLLISKWSDSTIDKLRVENHIKDSFIFRITLLIS